MGLLLLTTSELVLAQSFAEERNFKFLLPSEKDAFHLVSTKPLCALLGAPNMLPWQVLLDRNICVNTGAFIQAHVHGHVGSCCVSRLQTESCVSERLGH